MRRELWSALVGGLFGAGLVVSGMTDTRKVQGWLDIFGNWDPTLAFVMGAALVPMALAWRLARPGQPALLGGKLPGPAPRQIDPALILGSVLFGMGWAIAGLCPGPAMAAISFGGTPGLIFTAAMIAGMILARPISRRMTNNKERHSKMDIRPLTKTYAVSPQIDLADLAAVKAAGFTLVIDNRPDGEIPPSHQADLMAAEARALGLGFVYNPILPGALSAENIALQAKSCAEAEGPVFAYCASGNRCSVIWALMEQGKRPLEELIATPARFGYDLSHLRARLEAGDK